jgi:DHA1 family bicyclomycin/chloramphenicol resistance-like MFS transporter
MSKIFIKTDKSFVITLLVLSNILASMSMDIHLPLAPIIMVDLQTSEFMVQMIFIISVILTTTAPLFWGPLSDCYGRRSLFIPACYFMVIGQFSCSIAPSIEWLLCARIIQYLGVGAILTVAMAVICDLYQGVTRAKMLSLLEMSIPVALAMAPIIGAYTALYLSWRYNFLFLGALQAILLAILLKTMPETLTNPKSFEWRQSCRAIKSVINNKLFMQYVMLFAIVNASYMIYITHSSFLFINGFGFDSTQFALSQSLMVCVYFLGLVIFRFLIKTFNIHQILNASMIGYSLYGILIIALLTDLIPFSPTTIISTMLISCLVSGPIITSCNSLALSSCHDYLGTSSAMIEFSIGSIAGIFMLLSSYIATENGFTSVYWVISATIVLSIGMWFSLSSQPSLNSEQKTL